MAYWHDWNELLEEHARQSEVLYLRYRIEDIERDLPAIMSLLGFHPVSGQVEEALRGVPKNQNTKGDVPSISWNQLPYGPLHRAFAELATRYGYD